MNTTRLASITAISLFALLDTGRAEVIFDSFDTDGTFSEEDWAGGAGWTGSQGYRTAVQFPVTAGDCLLDAVTLPVSRYKIDSWPHPGVLRVRLARDAGGAPGTTVEILSLNQDIWPEWSNPFSTVTTLPSASRPFLSQGSKYWIVLEVSEMWGLPDYLWHTSSNGPEIPYRTDLSSDGLPTDPWEGAQGLGRNALRVYATPTCVKPLSIRFSQVELSWNSCDTFFYQLQYTTDLQISNAWHNLGQPVLGNGSRLTFTDDIIEGQPRRYYRLVPARPPAIRCIEFEEPGVGTTYVIGSSLTENDTTMQFEKFEVSPGDWEFTGHAVIDDRLIAGGTGQDMDLNNINLRFEFDRCVDQFRLKYGDSGGNENLEVNGAFTNVVSLAELNGVTLGGVLVHVLDSGLGDGRGRLSLFSDSNPIDTLAIGGQELWLDQICITECPEVAGLCIDFEDLSDGTIYVVGDSFVDSGVDHVVERFQWENGEWTDKGQVVVTDSQQAGHVGQDLFLNNANVRILFEGCMQEVTLRFGGAGGNVNLEINGALANAGSFFDLDGVTVGGVLVKVADLGGGLGRIELNGTIESISLGGQELWVDHICYRECERVD